MTAQYDLHLHSLWSYDACSPVAYYFGLARQKNLRAIAITDHHTMDSLDDVAAAARRFPEVGFFAGAELTVTTSIGAVDMVCLGLPRTTPPELEALFEQYRQWQRATGAAFSRAMTKIGYGFDDGERLALLRTYRAEHAIARQGVTHVNNIILRRELTRRGILQKPEELGGLWGRLREQEEFPEYPAAGRVLPLVKQHGGVVLIAHPLYYFNRNDRVRMNQLLDELQFDGVECAHSIIPPELTQVYRKFCREHKLLSSGGSDCHCDPVNYCHNFALDRDFADHCGEESWLDELLERVELHRGE